MPHVSSCVCCAAACQARDHGKSGSLIRSSALLPRSKLGTRNTPHPDDMYSPTRQPAKRCREQSLWRQPTAEVERAACAEIDMARRPSSRTMPLARRREPAARWRAPRLGAAEVRRLHHSRTTPAPLPRGSGAPHIKTGRGCAFHMRSGAVHKWEWCSGGAPPRTAPVRCHMRRRARGRAPGAPLPVGRGRCTGGGRAFPRGPPSHELATPS